MGANGRLGSMVYWYLLHSYPEINVAAVHTVRKILLHHEAMEDYHTKLVPNMESTHLDLHGM